MSVRFNGVKELTVPVLPPMDASSGYLLIQSSRSTFRFNNP